MKNVLYNLAKKVGLILKKKKLFVTTVESCTGGMLAASITDVAGSSAYFERGFIVYSNIAKKELLGVKRQTLKQFGAVSEEVVREMAIGGLQNSHAKVSIAITGIAGPTGGTKSKPKGTICFALGYKRTQPKTITKYFRGNRNTVRKQAVEFALRWLYTTLVSRCP